MSEWIVKRGTLERRVPDSATLLRLAQEKRLRPSDLLFHPDLQRWIEARDVSEIASAFAEPSSADPLDAPPTVSAPADPSTHNQPASLGSASADAQMIAMLAAWGAASRFMGFIGGAVALWGGVTLLNLKAAGENSLIEALAHGIGIYCIGKGLFMMAIFANFKAALDHALDRLKR